MKVNTGIVWGISLIALSVFSAAHAGASLATQESISTTSLQKIFPDLVVVADLANLKISGNATYQAGQLVDFQGSFASKKAVNILGLSLRKGSVDFSNERNVLLITGHGSWLGLSFTAEYQLSITEPGAHTVNFSLDEPVAADGWQPTGLRSYLDTLNFADKSGMTVRLRDLSLKPVVSRKEQKIAAYAEAIFGNAAGISTEENEVSAVLQGTFSQETSITLYPVVLGTIDFLGTKMRAALFSPEVSNDKLVLLGKAMDTWNLADGFPKAFAEADLKAGVMGQVRMAVGKLSWEDTRFVLSSYADSSRDLSRGFLVEGKSSFNPAAELDPFLQNLTKDKHPWPIYVKQDGERPIAGRYTFAFDPAKKEEAKLHMILETGDIGLFFRFLNQNELGVKDIFADVTFNPFTLKASGRSGFSYAGFEKPMKAAIELSADEERFTIGVSGAGDADYTRTLELLLGPWVVAFLGQKIILRDLAFECSESWASLLAAFPTAGLSIFALPSAGFSGGLEIGPRTNPLQILFRIRGGVDLKSWLFELFYDSKSSWIPLVFFLVDVYLHVLTFGQKKAIAGDLLDMNRIQLFVESLFPVMLDGFYLRFIPRDTRMGEISLGYGLGGNVRLRSFGQEVGADLFIDQSGTRAVAFIDPFDWGIISLYPSLREGPVVSFFTKEYNSLKAGGLKLSNWAKSTKEKIPLELFANEKGLHVGTNVGVRVADSFVGALAGVVSPDKVSLNGQLALQMPGILEKLGISGQGLVVTVSGTSCNVERPIDVLSNTVDASKIMLEVEFTQAFNTILEVAVKNAFSSATTMIQQATQAFVDQVFSQSGMQELDNLRAEKDRLCSEKIALGFLKDPVGCGLVTARLSLLEGKNFVLDSLDQLTGLPEAVRNALKVLSNMGLRLLSDGKVLFDGMGTLATIERVHWKGTLKDFSQGILSNVQVEARVLGVPLVFSNITFDLFAPVKSIVSLIKQVIGLVRNNIGVFLPFLQEPEFKKTLDDLEKAAEEAAEKRLQEELAKEAQNTTKRSPEKSDLEQTVALTEGWDDLAGLAH